MTAVLLHNVPLEVLDIVHHHALDLAVPHVNTLHTGSIVIHLHFIAGVRGAAFHARFLLTKSLFLLVQDHVLAGFEGAG